MLLKALLLNTVKPLETMQLFIFLNIMIVMQPLLITDWLPT